MSDFHGASGPCGPSAGQGTASLTDVATKLDGITRNLSSLVKAFQGRLVVGTFAFSSATASITIQQAAVKSTSFIFWSPTNAAGGTLEGSAKKLYISAVVPGTSFTLSTASGGNAAGTETFSYGMITVS